jgi:hypothetical protein
VLVEPLPPPPGGGAGDFADSLVVAPGPLICSRFNARFCCAVAANQRLETRPTTARRSMIANVATKTLDSSCNTVDCKGCAVASIAAWHFSKRDL